MRLKRTCFLLIVVALAGCVSARDVGVPSVAENEGDRPSTVRFCTLLAHPEQFDGRRVRVHAVYRSGFEWSELYCVACRGSRQMWLEFAESYEPPRTRPDRRALHGGKSVVGRTVDVVAMVRFIRQGITVTWEPSTFYSSLTASKALVSSSTTARFLKRCQRTNAIGYLHATDRLQMSLLAPVEGIEDETSLRRGRCRNDRRRIRL
jgi:hypothetical protein